MSLGTVKAVVLRSLIGHNCFFRQNGKQTEEVLKSILLAGTGSGLNLIMLNFQKRSIGIDLDDCQILEDTESVTLIAEHPNEAEPFHIVFFNEQIKKEK